MSLRFGHRKVLLRAPPAVVVPPAGGGPFVFVAGTNAGSSNSNDVTTGPINTTGANFLVLNVADYAAGAAGTLSDNKSNTWIGLTAISHTTLPRTRMFYCASATVGAGHTFTYSGTSIFPSISVAAFSGAHASPFDVQNGAHNGGFSDDAAAIAGSITPTEGNELVVAGVSHVQTVVSIGGGFTIVGTPPAIVGGTSLGGGLAYLIQTSAAAANPTWTLNAATAWAAKIAAFKEA